MMYLIFFFQAEDGIRDLTVTGVQTCALPICLAEARIGRTHEREHEDAESRAERNHHSSERVQIVPAQADIDRQAYDHEGPADVCEQAGQDAPGSSRLECRLALERRGDFVDRQSMPRDEIDDLDEGVVLVAHRVPTTQPMNSTLPA